MKVSIVSAVYNRRPQFENVLKSVALSAYDNFEYIVVDDASKPEHSVKDLEKSYPFLRVIEVKPEEKWWHNPCIPYNMGFREASGEAVILLGSECVVTSDVITYVAQNQTTENYFCYGCYCITDAMTKELGNHLNSYKDIQEFIEPVIEKSPTISGEMSCGWYCHPEYRNVMYHFMASIHKTRLDELGGFDEAFANGDGFDDDDFRNRAQRLLTGITVANPYCIHQAHEKILKPNHWDLVAINQEVYHHKNS